jgi:pSer/pThr/pTyr-binding forkhead associated (FHA) protein
MANDPRAPYSSQSDDETTVVQFSAEASELTAAGEPCLVVFYGKDIGHRYFLTAPMQLIGRASEASIPVEGEAVSRRHAELHFDQRHLRQSAAGGRGGAARR